ncbi:hypothetical protein Droror1_Dr00001573 [Drosera rotundifolia]
MYSTNILNELKPANNNSCFNKISCSDTELTVVDEKLSLAQLNSLAVPTGGSKGGYLVTHEAKRKRQSRTGQDDRFANETHMLKGLNNPKIPEQPQHSQTIHTNSTPQIQINNLDRPKSIDTKIIQSKQIQNQRIRSKFTQIESNQTK